MTPQELIDKWALEIERIKEELPYQSNEWIRYRMKEELRMATLFCVQLCLLQIDMATTRDHNNNTIDNLKNR